MTSSDPLEPDTTAHDTTATAQDATATAQNPNATGTATVTATATDHDATVAAHDSLNGLATGDAFGAQFFVPDNLPALRARLLPPAPWPWTDDTEMACSVLLAPWDGEELDQDALARDFARHHDFDRGYGPATNRMLRLVREGGDWRELAVGLFEGSGSWGNGAAMRVAPLGAGCAGRPALAAEQAARSARVTHTHPEAVAGAVAVAVAAAVAAAGTGGGAELLDTVLSLTQPGRVRAGIAEARELLAQPHAELAAHRLGNGRQVSAVDTVPFALWCAARHLEDYEAALWACASVGGDVDTTCAIVGGIVAARVGTAGIPAAWRESVEPLPAWFYGFDSWADAHAVPAAERYPCRCCGRLVHDQEPGEDTICPLCFWAQDGPHRSASLAQAQANVREFGACDRRSVSFVRRPLPGEPVDPDWRPIS